MDGEGDRDGAGDPPTWGADLVMVSGPGDGQQDRTRAGGRERTIGVGGVSVIAEGDRESISLGDGVSLGDGNADLWGLDIATASVKPLEEAGTIVRPPTAFMATNGVVEVGGEERAFAQWKVEW